MFKNKRGQFYLIAAIIIIGIILGFVVISNYSEKTTDIKIYDLKEDLKIESAKVLDYGTYNELNEEEMKELLRNFTETYSQQVGEDIEIYFIFGNTELIIVATYSELKSETIYIGNISLETTKGEYTIQEYYPEKNKVSIIINEIEYKFKLKKGENFYFVISQEIGEEQYIVTG